MRYADPESHRKFPCVSTNEDIDPQCRLVAIMTGRFRMTVPDCMSEFQNFGQQILGRPRFITALSFGLGNRYKYSTARLDLVLKDMTKRRAEIPAPEHMISRISFPSGQGLCRT